MSWEDGGPLDPPDDPREDLDHDDLLLKMACEECDARDSWGPHPEDPEAYLCNRCGLGTVTIAQLEESARDDDAAAYDAAIDAKIDAARDDADDWREEDS